MNNLVVKDEIISGLDSAVLTLVHEQLVGGVRDDVQKYVDNEIVKVVDNIHKEHDTIYLLLEDYQRKNEAVDAIIYINAKIKNVDEGFERVDKVLNKVLNLHQLKTTWFTKCVPYVVNFLITVAIVSLFFCFA